MMNKKHEAPEFQVIRLNEANAKFYAASEKPSPDNPAVNGSTNSLNYSKNDVKTWF